MKLLQVLGFVIVLALLVAALVLADRKIWAAVQMRKGPNVVGAVDPRSGEGQRKRSRHRDQAAARIEAYEGDGFLGMFV